MSPANRKKQILGIMGNVSIGYNLQSAGIALAIAGDIWVKPDWVAFISLGTPYVGILRE